MSIYITSETRRNEHFRWCMAADHHEDLERLARILNLNPIKWVHFQNTLLEYYELSSSAKVKALRLGAREISMNEFVLVFLDPFRTDYLIPRPTIDISGPLYIKKKDVSRDS